MEDEHGKIASQMHRSQIPSAVLKGNKVSSDVVWPPPPGKARPSTAHIKYRQLSPLCLDWQRQKVTGAGIYIMLSRCISTHAFVDLLSTSMTPLVVACLHPTLPCLPHRSPSCWLVQIEAHCKYLCTHALILQGPQARQHWLPVSVMPQPEAPLLTGWSSLKFAGKHTHSLLPTPPLWGRYRQ